MRIGKFSRLLSHSQIPKMRMQPCNERTHAIVCKWRVLRCCELEKKIRADDTARRIGSKKLGSRRVQERRRWWCWTSSPREEGVWRRRAIKWHERSVPRIGGQAPIGTDASWKYETPSGRAVHQHTRIRSFGPALFPTFVPIAINEVFILTEVFKSENCRARNRFLRSRELVN